MYFYETEIKENKLKDIFGNLEILKDFVMVCKYGE